MTVILGLVAIIVLGEWTGLARALIGSPIYAAVLDGLLIGLALVTLWRARRTWQLGTRPRPHPMDLVIAGFVVLAFVQMWNPNVPSLLVGLEGFRKTAFTVLGYVIVRLTLDDRPERFFAWFLVASLPAFALAIATFVLPTGLEQRIIETSGASPMSFMSGPVTRAFVPTAGPFHLGMLAGMALITGIGLGSASLDPRLRRAVVAALPVAAVALGMTLTRANMIAALIGSAVTGLAIHPITGRSGAVLRAGVPMLLVLVVGLGVARVYVPPPEPGSPTSSPAPTLEPDPSPSPSTGINLNPLDDRSFLFRLQYWSDQLEAIAERPLIGYGTSSAADGFGRLYEGTGKVRFQPHSLYLKAALELGLLGLALLVAILGGALILGLNGVLRQRTSVASIGLGISVMVMISGISGPMLDAYPANLLFWSVIGWLVREGSPPLRRVPEAQGLSA